MSGEVIAPNNNKRYAIAVNNMIKTTDDWGEAQRWFNEVVNATIYVRLEDAVSGALQTAEQTSGVHPFDTPAKMPP